MSTQPPHTPWSARAADDVERLVGTVRDKATGPVLRAVRAMVFGLLAAVLLIITLVLVTIAFVRVLDLLPGGIWVAYLITGLVFLLLGFWVWSKRTSPA